jgi:hypothetical protein
MDSCCSSAPDLKELFIDGNGISKFSDRMILPLFVSGILQALIRKWSSSLGIPKLLYLEVFLSRGLGDGLTVGCSGFPCLKEFIFDNSRLHWLLFEPGAMPKTPEALF